MQNLAMALAIAVKYIEGRENEAAIDQDVMALEEISANLTAATPDEQEAVIAAFINLGSPRLIEGLGITPNG